MIGRTRHPPENARSSDPIAIRRLRRQAFLLEYVTVGWNIFEGIVAILVGLAAGSVALVGFGLDSMVEVFASLVVIVELRRGDRRREGSAVRLIGGGYLVKVLMCGNRRHCGFFDFLQFCVFSMDLR